MIYIYNPGDFTSGHSLGVINLYRSINKFDVYMCLDWTWQKTSETMDSWNEEDYCPGTSVFRGRKFVPLEWCGSPTKVIICYL